MLAYRWHTGKPGAKRIIMNPERDQIRAATWLTFYVGMREPLQETMRLAGLPWKLAKKSKGRKHRYDVPMPYLVVVYKRVGPNPKPCTEGG